MRAVGVGDVRGRVSPPDPMGDFGRWPEKVGAVQDLSLYLVQEVASHYVVRLNRLLFDERVESFGRVSRGVPRTSGVVDGEKHRGRAGLRRWGTDVDVVIAKTPDVFAKCAG